MKLTADAIEIERHQKHIADRMGISWEAYAARATNGIHYRSGYSTARFRFRFRWSGLPRITPQPAGVSALRLDRSQHPKVVYLTEEERTVIAGLTGTVDEKGNYDCPGARVREGEAVKVLPDPLHNDVARLSICIPGFRAVVAIYAVRAAWRMPRFGLDAMSQFRDGHWRDVTLRLYRR